VHIDCAYVEANACALIDETLMCAVIDEMQSCALIDETHAKLACPSAYILRIYIGVHMY